MWLIHRSVSSLCREFQQFSCTRLRCAVAQVLGHASTWVLLLRWFNHWRPRGICKACEVGCANRSLKLNAFSSSGRVGTSVSVPCGYKNLLMDFQISRPSGHPACPTQRDHPWASRKNPLPVRTPFQRDIFGSLLPRGECGNSGKAEGTRNAET